MFRARTRHFIHPNQALSGVTRLYLSGGASVWSIFKVFVNDLYFSFGFDRARTETDLKENRSNRKQDSSERDSRSTLLIRPNINYTT